jgi:hypothetical protein
MRKCANHPLKSRQLDALLESKNLLAEGEERKLHSPANIKKSFDAN